MLSFIGRVLLLFAFLSNTALAQNGEEGPVKQEMNALTSRGFQLAFDALSTAQHFYPFALYTQNGEVKNVVFDMKSGEQPPPANEWVKRLFLSLRKRAEKNPAITSASVVRLHVAKQKTSKEEKGGEPLLGVWVLVDHRQANPVVAFMPLIKQEDGSFKPGKMVYSGSDNWIFQ